MPKGNRKPRIIDPSPRRWSDVKPEELVDREMLLSCRGGTAAAAALDDTKYDAADRAESERWIESMIAEARNDQPLGKSLRRCAAAVEWHGTGRFTRCRFCPAIGFDFCTIHGGRTATASGRYRKFTDEELQTMRRSQLLARRTRLVEEIQTVDRKLAEFPA